MKHILLMLLLITVVSGCGASGQKKSETVELTVSAAASMQDVLNDIKESYEKEHSNIKVVFNFGSSGALQQQIEQGAPVDVFLSASVDKFDLLVDKGLIDQKTKRNLVGNQIVLVVPKNSQKEIQTFDDLLTKADSISIGIPESVPAGKYAKEALENSNLWDRIEDKLIFAKDVRQVLTYVETGNVDAGIVYLSDAMQSEKVKSVVAAVPVSHSAIIYPVGIITSTNKYKEAMRFHEYLQSEAVLKKFEEYGFIEVE
ncbi:molybdate ABC transporter substrate-binding protein [Fredinandcohnia sp. 179-A 10B2 NHS]|uniref:molybdate ABC transporter substrate-binding protein n=1 Tax=Fredinandcohnia sp. 179-A 10B2 NHS TaxID=3235176 RepID=UPI0039A0C94C